MKIAPGMRLNVSSMGHTDWHIGFFFQAEDGIRDADVTGVQTCALPIYLGHDHGTVGAVALDRYGSLIAGTSTGGTCCKMPGRVGDSPLIGCGCYADVEAGGVSCTGWGEAIMKIVMAKTAVDLLRSAFVGAPHAVPTPSGDVAPVTPQGLAEACIRLLADQAHGRGGLILLDREGRPGFAFNTPRMAYGYVAPDSSFVISV